MIAEGHSALWLYQDISMTISTVIPPVSSPRPLRADARRNHERLLCAARKTFDEQGAEACLDEIAKRAGVGIGTLYRHFPTRRDMLEAVLHDGIAELCLRADHLLVSADPGDALASWLRAVIAHAAASRGLAAELLRTTSEPGEKPVAKCEEMRAMGARLLARAQAAGEVRADVTANDLFTLVNGIAWASDHCSGDGDYADRMLSLMLDGLKGSPITLVHPTTAPER
jgi:AcrR family transcriptional regulator